MIKRYRRRYLDDDEDDILQDGEVGYVPLRLMDSMQRDVRQHFGSLRVTDVDGGTEGLHRPGYRIADTAARDEIEAAHEEYRRELANAWRGGPVCDARKKVTTQRDPQGRLQSTYETTYEQEEEDETHDARPARGMTLDELQRDHQARMQRIYNEFDRELEQRWRAR